MTDVAVTLQVILWAFVTVAADEFQRLLVAVVTSFTTSGLVRADQCYGVHASRKASALERGRGMALLARGSVVRLTWWLVATRALGCNSASGDGLLMAVETLHLSVSAGQFEWMRCYIRRLPHVSRSVAVIAGHADHGPVGSDVAGATVGELAVESASLMAS